MPHRNARSRFPFFPAPPAHVAGLVFALTLAASARQNVLAQQSQPAPPATTQPDTQQPPAAQTPQPSPDAAPAAAPADTQPSPASPPADTQSAQPETQPAPARPAATNSATPSAQPGEISEDEVRKLLVGKQLFLRGGYLDNSLTFNEHGVLIGHSPQGSYTLSAIQIDKVHLTRHKVELEGERFGLHFLGALPYEDPTKAVDRVNITPKKKEVKITVDRELVVKPKQEKEKGKPFWVKNSPAPKPAAHAPGTPAASPAAPGAAPPSPSATQPGESPDAEAQAEIAAAKPEERPADPASVTTTSSPAHANKVLVDALDKVFAQGFDARLMDSMPTFWKLYYQAAAAKSDYRPADPGVLRQNMVDQKARLTSEFEPASNQFAQDSGVAGMALYHVVIGADGKPQDIAVARPIGFGLDESAVDSIREATFSPAVKDGKPVPVLLDLVVEFRIYSKRTAVTSSPGAPTQPHSSALPGPYSVDHQEAPGPR
jgi:hypothetical protein